MDGLPDPADPWFPPKLNEVVFSDPDYREQLRGIVTDRDQPELRRFRAFYGYLNLLRRSLDFTLYREFCDRFLDDFGGFAMSRLLRSQMFLNEVHNGRYSADVIKTALHHAEAARGALAGHFGVDSHWASVVAEMQIRRPKSKRDDDVVRSALAAQESAIVNSNGSYPQYYFIRAQLLYLLGDWDDALESISQAIDQENSALRDYAVRVGTYRSLRTEIELSRRIEDTYRESRAEIAELTKQADRTRDEIREIRSTSLTLVGLLGAMIAFLSSSYSLAARLDYPQSIRLILVASASIVVVFLSILAVASPSRPLRSYVAMFAVGSLAVILCVVLLQIVK